MKETIINLFFDYFRNVKGYEDWTDNEIIFSYNDDDINEFLSYLKRIIKEQ